MDDDQFARWYEQHKHECYKQQQQQIKLMLGQVITVRCSRVVCCMPSGDLRSSTI